MVLAGCRGQGQVFVTLVRQTEQQLLALGEPIKTFGLKAKERLEHTRTLREAQRQRLTLALTTAMSHHDAHPETIHPADPRQEAQPL